MPLASRPLVLDRPASSAGNRDQRAASAVRLRPCCSAPSQLPGSAYCRPAGNEGCHANWGSMLVAACWQATDRCSRHIQCQAPPEPKGAVHHPSSPPPPPKHKRCCPCQAASPTCDASPSPHEVSLLQEPHGRVSGGVISGQSIDHTRPQPTPQPINVLALAQRGRALKPGAGEEEAGSVRAGQWQMPRTGCLVVCLEATKEQVGRGGSAQPALPGGAFTSTNELWWSPSIHCLTALHAMTPPHLHPHILFAMSLPRRTWCHHLECLQLQSSGNGGRSPLTVVALRPWQLLAPAAYLRLTGAQCAGGSLGQRGWCLHSATTSGTEFQHALLSSHGSSGLLLPVRLSFQVLQSRALCPAK